MTDRYERIRQAVANIRAAAEARNGIAWRDDHAGFVVHAHSGIILELLKEREVMKAEIQKLWKALRLAEEHINDTTLEWYNSGQRVLAEIRTVLSKENKE